VPGQFDCDECRYGISTKDGAYRTPPRRDDAERAAMHCGWTPEEYWTGAGCVGKTFAAKPSVGFPGIEWTEDECPGSATRSPAVVEIGEAYAAFDAGALREFFPDVTNSVAQGLLELKRAMSEYERVATATLKEASKNSG